MLWLIYAVLIIYLSYLLFVRPQNYWRRHNVKQNRAVPIFGDNAWTFLQLESFTDMLRRLYNSFPNESYVGSYEMTQPFLILRDPELIKQITVKDFDHFTDHRAVVSEDVDPYWSKNLFALQGQKWRDMRATLSPSFTATKMRAMFTLMNETSQQFINHFLQKDENIQVLEMKDAFTRFANDVIANCAFGVKCDSLAERTNEFYMQGLNATNFSGFWNNLKFFIYSLSPKLAKALRLKLFNTETSEFFKNIVTNTIKMREEQNIVRPDMINLLMEARKGHFKHEDDSNSTDSGFATATESYIGLASKPQKQELTDIDVTAQALIFFFAGFDTVSTLLTFLTYELALNPDIQERLRNEVDETIENCDGKLTYATLTQMKYMDMVISETLRKWPPAIIADRMCTKPYTIQPVHAGESPVHIKEGEVVWLPIIGIHYDCKFYPNPQRFDPERFNEENKHNINPYTYLTFGVGPRNCIGSRFALMEIKTVLFHILSKFEIVVVEKTQVPISISKKQFNLGLDDGAWLGLKKR